MLPDPKVVLRNHENDPKSVSRSVTPPFLRSYLFRGFLVRGRTRTDCIRHLRAVRNWQVYTLGVVGMGLWLR